MRDSKARGARRLRQGALRADNSQLQSNLATGAGAPRQAPVAEDDHDVPVARREGDPALTRDNAERAERRAPAEAAEADSRRLAPAARPTRARPRSNRGRE